MTILIDLRTDLVPGVEFAHVRVEQLQELPRGGEIVAGNEFRERAAFPGEPYGQGRRIAEYAGLSQGDHVFRIRLVESSGRVALERIVILTARQTAIFTVTMSRDCRGVMCPGSDSESDLIACLGARCVDPRCTSENQEACPDAQCRPGETELAAVACARRVCSSEGVWLNVGGECNLGEWCNPDTGCEILPAEDGMPAEGQFRWALTMGSSRIDGALAVAVDASSQVFVAGEFAQVVNFGGEPLTAEGSDEAFIAAYSPEGEYRWAYRFGDAIGSDEASATAVARDGTVYVSGRYEGSVDFGGGLLTSAGDKDAFIASYDNEGLFRWAKRFGGSASDDAHGLAIDPFGNVLIAGKTGGGIDLGGGALESAGGFDLYVAKLDSDGRHVWSRRYGALGDETVNGLAVDASGNVFVGGAFTQSFSVGEATLTSAGFEDAYVLSLDLTGDPRWAVAFGGGGFDEAAGIGLDSSDRLFVTGTFRGNVDFGEGLVSAVGNKDVFVISYTNQGALRWVETFGSLGADSSLSLAIDAADNVLVSGYFEQTIDWGMGPMSSAGLDDAFVLSLTGEGTYRWARRLGGLGSDRALSIAVTRDGKVLTGGGFEQEVDFGDGVRTSAGRTDIFVVGL